MKARKQQINNTLKFCYYNAVGKNKGETLQTKDATIESAIPYANFIDEIRYVVIEELSTMKVVDTYVKFIN